MTDTAKWTSRRLFVCVGCVIAVSTLVARPDAGAGQAGEPRGWRPGRPYPRSSRVLGETAFLKPGLSLIVYTLPVSPPGHELYLCTANARLRVTKQQDLVGHVKLDSRDKVLQYTRLFSSPSFGRLMADWRWIEMVPARAVDAKYVFGRSDFLAGMSEAQYQESDWFWRRHLKEFEHRTFPGVLRFDGVLMNAEWDRLKLDSPKVTQTGDGYTITRWLARFKDCQGPPTSTVYRVEHRVSGDGRMKEQVLGQRTLEGITLVPTKLSFFTGWR